MIVSEMKRELEKLANPEQAKILQRFFKTEKGEYGEGDVFLGIKVPEQRKIAKRYKLGIDETGEILNSKIHEHRMIALFILIERYKKADEKEKKEIFEFYLRNTKNINNWDLVDLSAPNIIGGYLRKRPKDVLYELAKSENLWERRIAIISTFAFIKENKFTDAIKIAEILVNNKHDLIHKAVGWMLREIGKKNQNIEEEFLKKNYKEMPRTMLRYSIERFDEEKRRFYMGK